MADVYDESGRRLFSHEELQRALAQDSERKHVQLRFSQWMRDLQWPSGLLAELRLAHAAQDLPTFSALLTKARNLYDAEQQNMPAAAAAIRHRLNLKYGA